MPPDARSELSRRAATAAAVVLPLALVGGALHALGRERSEDAQRALDRAGQLLNGKVLNQPVAHVVRERTARGPRLVLIGNSFANTNVNLTALAAAFDLDPRDAVRLSIPSTIGTHWYALLKHQLFRDGVEPPDHVVILSDLQSALATTPQSEASYANLLGLIDGDDPEIEARIGQSPSFWWSRVLEGRERVRHSTLDAVRFRAVRPLFGRLPEPRVQRLTDEHMDLVFHPSRTDLSLHRHALPVTVGEEQLAFDPDTLPTPERSFIPAIAALCARHGARLVMLRNVASPGIPPDRGDVVLPGVTDRVRALLDPYGGLLLEFQRLAMIGDQFENLDHMTEEGSRRFSRAIYEALRDLGAHEERGRLVRPPQPTFTAPVGELPASARALASIRRSWVPIPDGGVARWDAADWPGDDGTFRVRIAIEPVGDALPTVTVAGAPLALTRLASGRWVGERAGAPPDGPWSIEVGARGGPVVVQALELGAGPVPRYVVGYRPDARAHDLELLGRAEVFDGQVWFDAVRPELPSTAPPVPGQWTLRDGPAFAAVFETTGSAWLSDFETIKHTPRRARCSPVRVLEDGEPLANPNAGCKEVRDIGLGRMCHAERRIYFAASDATDPWTNGRRYTLALDPGRSCDGGVWLYPGDRVGLRVPAERLRELRDGASGLRVGISALSGEGPIDVRLESAGETLLSRQLEPDELAAAVVLPIDPPLGPDAPDVRVIVSQSDGWSLLTSAALLSTPLPWSPGPYR